MREFVESLHTWRRRERANLAPEVHVITLAGNGSGFCGGYDLVDFAEGAGGAADHRRSSPLDPAVQAAYLVTSPRRAPMTTQLAETSSATP